MTKGANAKGNRMSALGQKRTSRQVDGMSAIPPKADIGGVCRDVCFVPKADIGGPIPKQLGHDGLHRGSLRIGSLRQLRAHSVQGAVRVNETELSHSVVSVANLTETTLDSATSPFRSDGIGI